jgi:hypothetical protein
MQAFLQEHTQQRLPTRQLQTRCTLTGRHDSDIVNHKYEGLGENMSDFKQGLTILSKKELSRKQFLEVVGGSFLGMVGVFRILQALDTPEPDLATSDKEVFGEREYGHTSQSSSKATDTNTPKFDEDAFG